MPTEMTDADWRHLGVALLLGKVLPGVRGVRWKPDYFEVLTTQPAMAERMVYGSGVRVDVTEVTEVAVSSEP